MFQSNGLKVLEDDKWLLLNPTYPIFARQSHVPRRALGLYLKAVAKAGRSTLDDRARYIADLDPDGGDYVTDTYLPLLSPDPLSFDNPKYLRIYAGLTPSQRSNARTGSRFAVGDFNQAQLRALNGIVFDDNMTLSVKKIYPNGTVIASAGSHADLNGEPTEVLADGIPHQARVTLTLRETAVASPYGASTDQKSSWMRSPLTADNIGYILFYCEHPEFGMYTGRTEFRATDFEKMRLGNQRAWSVYIDYSLNLGTSFSLSDHALGPIIPFDQLPPPFLAEIKAGHQRIADQLKNVRVPTRTQNPPPPW